MEIGMELWIKGRRDGYRKGGEKIGKERWR